MSLTAMHEIKRPELKALITLFEAELKQLKRINQGCHGCVHSHHRGDGTCDHWKQTVPAEARAAGCDEWKYDEVPF